MLVTWMPLLVYEVVNLSFLQRGDIVYNSHLLEALELLPTQYGSLLAITYFVKTSEGRERWARKLGDLGCPGFASAGEDEQRLSEVSAEVSAKVTDSVNEEVIW